MLFNKVWSITKEIFFGQALFLFKLPKAKLQFLVPILVLISSWGLTDSIQVLFTIKKYIYNFKTLSCVIFLKDTNYFYIQALFYPIKADELGAHPYYRNESTVPDHFHFSFKKHSQYGFVFGILHLFKSFRFFFSNKTSWMQFIAQQQTQIHFPPKKFLYILYFYIPILDSVI